MKAKAMPGVCCSTCNALIYEYRLCALHYLDGRVEPYVDPVVSLLCDCGRDLEPKQLSLLEDA